MAPIEIRDVLEMACVAVLQRAIGIMGANPVDEYWEMH